MGDTKELIKSIKAEDYYKKADLHIHTNCSDGVMSPQEVIKQALKNNLEYISITDHNTIEAYNNLESIDLKGLNLVKGIEFDCWYGYTLLHIIGYGVDIENKELLSLCAKSKKATEADFIRFFSGRKAGHVIKAIKNAGGVPILAHPACCWNLNLKNMIKSLVGFGLEGLEVYYPYKRHRGIIKFYTIKQVENIANELELLKTGGSDSHGYLINTID